MAPESIVPRADRSRSVLAPRAAHAPGRQARRGASPPSGRRGLRSVRSHAARARPVRRRRELRTLPSRRVPIPADAAGIPARCCGPPSWRACPGRIGTSPTPTTRASRIGSRRAGDRVEAVTRSSARLPRRGRVRPGGEPPGAIVPGTRRRAGPRAPDLAISGRAGVGPDDGASRRPARRPGYLGRPISAEAFRKCLNCHATNFRAAREPEGRPEAPRPRHRLRAMSRPGGHHRPAIAAHFPELAIARPKLAAAAQVVALCGDCHRAPTKTTPADAGFVRYQASGLVLSRCYTESAEALSCVTCHNPHKDAGTSAASYEARCLACHGAPRPSATSANRPKLGPTPARPVPSTRGRIASPATCPGSRMPSPGRSSRTTGSGSRDVGAD